MNLVRSGESPLQRLVSVIIRYRHEIIRGAGILAPLFIGWYIISRMDPMSKAKREARKKANSVLEEVKKRQNRFSKLSLTEYESIVASDIISPDLVTTTFDDIGGLQEVKTQIMEALILPIKRPELFKGKLLKIPRGILLFGPPGTGKTMIAKAICKTSESAFINLNLANMLQKWWGESEKIVAAIFSLAEKVQPAIIFIDEIDCLFRKRQDSDHEVSNRMKALFMSLWDGLGTTVDKRITIVGATNRPWTVDEAILRRMPLTFKIDLPNVNQRKSILEVILKDERVDYDLDLRAIATATEGYSGSDLQALCENAARIPLREMLNYNRSFLRDLTLPDFIQAMATINPTGRAAEDYRIQTEGNGLGNTGSRTDLSRGINFNFYQVPNGNNQQQ
eukprot:TRINITY_DN2957_c0_g3_i1.p1 TRINITY_DN2957_c0_g3~~TRINITY_DN2957_c0_g3_i1.p1  ORF type:complete len:393 (+),score=76.41 TRINITY_DN2957_c0_g3_i1:147-1325(+)